MARGRRAAHVAGASNTEAPPPSLTEDLDAEAGLLALQKHVDGASHGLTTTTATSTLLNPNSSITAAQSSLLYQPATATAAVYPDPEAQIHPDLRSAQHLSSALSIMSTAVPPQQNPASVPVAAMPQGSPIPTESPSSTDGRRGPRRELSQSKRAAQNRAAQRAFRQRKEGYIKKLEHQVSDLATLEAQLKQVQTENYSLREYIIHLQSKLLDAKAELPSPPPNLNLSSPAAGANSSVSAAASALASAAAAAIAPAQPEHKAPAGLSSTNPLARVAQAVAQLGGGSATSNPGVSGSNGVKADKDDKDVKTGDEMDTAEEIDRQLQGPQDSYAPAMASV